MKTLIGRVLFALVVIILAVFAIMQTQNVNDTQAKMNDIQSLALFQAKSFADQGTAVSSTMIAVETQAADQQNQSDAKAATAQAQSAATISAMATRLISAQSTAQRAATTQAQSVVTYQTQVAQAQATVSALKSQLSDANSRLSASPIPATDIPEAQLGDAVSSSGVDKNGCAVDSQSVFAPNQTIYVVSIGRFVPEGTTIFVRLSRENTPIEDTPEITADRDYENTCINFLFQPTGADFVKGNYDAQFFINGNVGPAVAMKVQ